MNDKTTNPTTPNPKNPSKEALQIAVRDFEEMEQMDLALQGEKMPLIDYTEREYNRSGERFLRDRPNEAKIAIKLLAAGFSNKAVAAKVHADRRTIRELRWRCFSDIEKQKEEVRSLAFAGMMESAEVGMEKLHTESITGKDALIMHGIYRDTYLQVAGGPVHNINISAHLDVAAEVKNMIAEAEEKVKQVLGRTIEPLELENSEPAL